MTFFGSQADDARGLVVRHGSYSCYVPDHVSDLFCFLWANLGWVVLIRFIFTSINFSYTLRDNPAPFVYPNPSHPVASFAHNLLGGKFSALIHCHQSKAIVLVIVICIDLQSHSLNSSINKEMLIFDYKVCWKQHVHNSKHMYHKCKRNHWLNCF